MNNTSPEAQRLRQNYRRMRGYQAFLKQSTGPSEPLLRTIATGPKAYNWFYGTLKNKE